MEMMAGLLVLAGCGYKLNQQVALGFPPFVTGIVEVVGVTSLLLEAFPSDNRFLTQAMNWYFRPGCGKGSWCIILIHVAVLLSIFQDKRIFHQDFGPVLLLLYCLTVLVASLPLHLVGVFITERTRHVTILILITAVALALTYVMYAVSLVFNQLGEVEISMVVVVALWTVMLQCIIHTCFPHSFSRGEATIVSQGLFLLFTFNHILLYQVSRRNPVRPYTITAPADTTFFLQTAGASGLVVALVMFIGPSLRNSMSFYGVLLGVTGAIATPVLLMKLEKHFVVWIYEFVTHRTSRLYLFTYWCGCSMAAVLLLRWSALSVSSKSSHHPKGESPNAKLSDCEDDEGGGERNNSRSDDYRGSPDVSSERKCDSTSRCESGEDQVKHREPGIREDSKHSNKTQNGWAHAGQGASPSNKRGNVVVARKYFHLLALCVYIPGVVIDREMLMVASTCAIVVFIILEVMRKVNVWPIGEALDSCYNVFVDKRDCGPVVMTHLYLLVGCTVPLWLYPHPLEDGVHPALLSGLLSLGVGDTAAAIFGSKFGVFRWPGTKKTVEGTMASILFQVLVLAAMDYAELMVGLEWTSALVAITLTSLLEAVTSQIDNLVLPLFMYILLADPLRINYR